MKNICFYVPKNYLNNFIFQVALSDGDPNDTLSPFRLLKSRFADYGYNLSTQDINRPENSVATIYNEMPLQVSTRKEQSYLIAFECELIKPDNWRENNHKKFKAIFALKEHNCKNTHTIKVQLPQKFKTTKDSTPWKSKKFCTLISGSHLAIGQNELYSKRVEWIDWFSKHAPDDFEFYGMNWNRRTLVGHKWIRALNKIPFWSKLFIPSLKCYKGPAPDKIQTLDKYKFSICFENVENVPGQITEKIFDCFFSGNVPIYRGAPDIGVYIPSNCYIDENSFKTKQELFNFLKSFTESDYNKHLNNVKKFLESPAYFKFSDEFFVTTLAEKILNDLNN
jgi:hypothetical protein